MMRAMTDHRPWFRTWRTGVPKTVAPFPRQSAFTLLSDSAAGFPGSTAIAFFGKHLGSETLPSTAPAKDIENLMLVGSGGGTVTGRYTFGLGS
jgi:hypothetical protein